MSTADTPAPAMEPPELTAVELDRLGALAKAATKGPWRWNGHWLDNNTTGPLLWYTNSDDGVHAAPEDAAHIAAFDPPTVLRLIASARRAASGSLPGGGQAFERFPALASHVQRMASTGATGSLREWGSFLEALNEALSAPPAPAAEPRLWAWREPSGFIGAKHIAHSSEQLICNATEYFIENCLPVPLYTAPQPGGAEAQKLREALECAKRQIKLLSERTVERIRGAGGNCDPPSRTYGPILARIDALASPPGDAQGQS